MPKRVLTTAECMTLHNMAIAARDQWARDAKVASGTPRLAQQFELQVAQATRWAEIFLSLPTITIGTDDDSTLSARGLDL